MSITGKVNTKQKISHTNQESKTHKHDKKYYASKTRTLVVKVKVNYSQPKLDKSIDNNIKHGMYKVDGKNVSGTAFEKHLENQSKLRNFYIHEQEQLDRNKRKYVTRRRRKVKSPLNKFTVTLLNHQTKFLKTLPVERQKSYLLKLGDAMSHTLRKMTGRDLVGYAVHTDTDNYHIDIVSSYIDTNNNRCASVGLQTIGMGHAGHLRNYDNGIQSNVPKKILTNIQKFKDDHKQIPTDVKINAETDKHFLAEFNHESYSSMLTALKTIEVETRRNILVAGYKRIAEIAYKKIDLLKQNVLHSNKRQKNVKAKAPDRSMEDAPQQEM